MDGNAVASWSWGLAVAGAFLALLVCSAESLIHAIRKWRVSVEKAKHPLHSSLLVTPYGRIARSGKGEFRLIVFNGTGTDISCVSAVVVHSDPPIGYQSVRLRTAEQISSEYAMLRAGEIKEFLLFKTWRHPHDGMMQTFPLDPYSDQTNWTEPDANRVLTVRIEKRNEYSNRPPKTLGEFRIQYARGSVSLIKEDAD